ncbi:hypothetical protein MOP95_20885, partial [Stenotrophomonas maltophilia]|nr:hypothetical protein [Stenotrophomonas maltophilia]
VPIDFGDEVDKRDIQYFANLMEFYDIKTAFTSLYFAYERLINIQKFSELSLRYPPISRLLRKRPMTW